MVFAKDRGTTNVLLPLDTQRDKIAYRAGILRGVAKSALGARGGSKGTEEEALSHPVLAFVSLFKGIV